VGARQLGVLVVRPKNWPTGWQLILDGWLSFLATRIRLGIRLREAATVTAVQKVTEAHKIRGLYPWVVRTTTRRHQVPAERSSGGVAAAVSPGET
jgi:hypothetical protein